MPIEIIYPPHHATKPNAVEHWAPGCTIRGVDGPYDFIIITPTVIPSRTVRIPLTGVLDASAGGPDWLDFPRGTSPNHQLPDTAEMGRMLIGSTLVLTVHPVGPVSVTITNVTVTATHTRLWFSPTQGGGTSAATEAYIEGVDLYAVAGSWPQTDTLRTATLLCDGPTGHEFYVANLQVYGPAKVVVDSVRDTSGPPWDPPKWFRYQTIQVQGAGAVLTIKAERTKGCSIDYRKGGNVVLAENDAIYMFDARFDRQKAFPGALLQGTFGGRVDGGGFYHFNCQASYVSFLSGQANAGATSITLDGVWDAASFPTGGGTIILSPNTANEEQITYTSRSGMVLTLAGPLQNTHPSGRRVCYPRDNANSLAIAGESGYFEFLIEGLGHDPASWPSVPAEGLLTTTEVTGRHAHAAFPNGGNHVGMLIEGVVSASPCLGINFYGAGRARVGGRNMSGHVKGVHLNLAWDGTGNAYHKPSWITLGSGFTMEFTIHGDTDDEAYVARMSLGSALFLGQYGEVTGWNPTWKFFYEPGCLVARFDGDGATPVGYQLGAVDSLRLMIGADGEVTAQGEGANTGGIVPWRRQVG